MNQSQDDANFQSIPSRAMQIATACMKSLVAQLDCPLDAIRYEAGDYHLDVNQCCGLDIPRNAVGLPIIAIWQTESTISFTGVNPDMNDAEVTKYMQRLLLVGFSMEEAAGSAVSNKCLVRNNVEFVIDETGCGYVSFGCYNKKYMTVDYQRADDIAALIYFRIRDACDAICKVLSKLKKEVKIDLLRKENKC